MSCHPASLLRKYATQFGPRRQRERKGGAGGKGVHLDDASAVAAFGGELPGMGWRFARLAAAAAAVISAAKGSHAPVPALARRPAARLANAGAPRLVAARARVG